MASVDELLSLSDLDEDTEKSGPHDLPEDEHINLRRVVISCLIRMTPGKKRRRGIKINVEAKNLRRSIFQSTKEMEERRRLLHERLGDIRCRSLATSHD